MGLSEGETVTYSIMPEITKYSATVVSIDENTLVLKSKIFRGYDAETPDIALPDEAINPKLWQMLVDINAKLTIILDSLRFESEGFKKSEEKIVNLSASGIRFTIDEKVTAGGQREIIRKDRQQNE